MGTPQSDDQFFAVAAVQETLGRSTDVDACVALSRRITGLLSQALEYFRGEQAGIACLAGCNFCCHLRVMVHPHEAIALFRHLGSGMPEEQAQLVRARLKANAAQLHQETAGQVRRPCAFLVDGQCSAYDVRPSACAGYHSLSREACERDHDSDGKTAGIPVSQALAHVATGLSEGMAAALARGGLGHPPVELQTAVAALLVQPALIGRWRAGRPWPMDARGLVRTR